MWKNIEVNVVVKLQQLFSDAHSDIKTLHTIVSKGKPTNNVFFFQTPVVTMSQNSNTHTKVPLPIKGWNCQCVTFSGVDWWESTLQIMLKWITASRLPSSHTRDYPVTYALIVRKREKMHLRKDSKHKGGCQNLKQACSLSLLPSWNLFNVQQLLGRNRHAGARVEKQNFTTARLALATWLDRLVI